MNNDELKKRLMRLINMIEERRKKMSWKNKIIMKAQEIEALLVYVNWILERDYIITCNDSCQKKRVINRLKTARDLIEDILKDLKR